MNGTVDFDRLFCCYCCWTVPTNLKERVILMTETLTTADSGSLCCASLELLTRDGFFFTWALQSQRRELFVLHPPLSTGSCLLLPACGRLRLVTLAGWAHPLSRGSYNIHDHRESWVLLKTIFDLCSWRQYLCSKMFYYREGIKADKISHFQNCPWMMRSESKKNH